MALLNHIPKAIIGRILRLMNTLSPATFAGELCDISAHDEFYGFNSAFIRARIILSLLHNLPVDAFIETGTYMGLTSLLVWAQTGLPVFTCEIDDGLFRKTQRRLLLCRRRVHLYHADSRDFLIRLVANKVCRQPFVYLDAHWGKDVPLEGELKIILTSFKEFVIAIDDFKIADDAGFRYDTYNGQSLSWEYIEESVLRLCPSIAVFVPSYRSERETGARTGYVLLSSTGLASSISRLIPSELLKRM